MNDSCNLVRTIWECIGARHNKQPRTYTINSTSNYTRLLARLHAELYAELYAEGVLRLCKQDHCISSSSEYVVMLLWMTEHNIEDRKFSVIGALDKCLHNIKKVYSIAYCFGELTPAARVMHMGHIYIYFTTYYIPALIATKAMALARNMCRYILSSKYRNSLLNNPREPIQHPYSTNAVLMQY